MRASERPQPEAPIFLTPRQQQVLGLVAAVAVEPGPAFSIRNNSEPDTLLNWAGESAGLVHEVLPAATIVERTVAQAETLLRNLAAVLQAKP